MSLYETIKDYVKNAGIGFTLAAAGLASGCYTGNSELDIAFEQEKPGISTSLEPGVLDPELEGEYVESLEQRGLEQDITGEEILNPLGFSESGNEGYVKVGGGIELEDGNSLRAALGTSSDNYSFDIDYISEDGEISSEFGSGSPTKGGSIGSKSLDSKLYSVLLEGEYRLSNGVTIGFMVNKFKLDEHRSEDEVDYWDITPPFTVTDYIYDDWKTSIDYESFGGKILEPFIFSLIKSKKIHDLKYNGHVHVEDSFFGPSDSYYENEEKEKTETLEAVLGVKPGEGDTEIELFYSTTKTDSTEEEVPDLTRMGGAFSKMNDQSFWRVDFIYNDQKDMPKELEKEIGFYRIGFTDNFAYGIKGNFEKDELSLSLPLVFSNKGLDKNNMTSLHSWLTQINKNKMRDNGESAYQKDIYDFEDFEQAIEHTKSVVLIPGVSMDEKQNSWDLWAGINTGKLTIAGYYLDGDVESELKLGAGYTLNNNNLVNIYYTQKENNTSDTDEDWVNVNWTHNF